MDKFEGIKRAEVTLRRNTYNTGHRPKILWRYIAATMLVFAVVLITTFTDYQASQLFKQDYIEQYAQD